MVGRVAAGALVALLGVAGSAQAEPLVFQHRFTAERPGASTGMTSHIVYPDYDGKPKPQAKIVLELPEGSRFDESVVPECTASNAEILARGVSACPPESAIGGGSGSVVTGFGPPIDPLSGELHLFHGPHQLVNVATPSGSDRAVLVSRLRIEGRRLINTPDTDAPPSAPGSPPDGRTVGKEVTLRVNPRSASGRGFLTTPDTCPAGGAWTFRFTVTYPDGGSDTATSPSPCRASRSGGTRRPTMHLRVRPRRATAGRRVRFRFRVESSSASCRRGATLRFAGKRARTDRHGRATIVRRFRRAGLFRARLSRGGCRSARASVRVRSARPRFAA